MLSSETGCQDSAQFNDKIPGSKHTTFLKTMEWASSALQSFSPLKSFDLHLSGCAFYSENPKRQMFLHHYCRFFNDDVAQAAIFDSDDANARLIGVEYIISQNIFDTLPKEERKYWHSHSYDVKSGSLTAPRVPTTLENPLMQQLTKTYGKTWIFWQVDKGDFLPLGPPQLMMVATKDGVWDKSLFEQRDKCYGWDTNTIVANRYTLTYPSPDPDADPSTPFRCNVEPVHGTSGSETSEGRT
ncbi:DUF1264 domain protein [Pelomyxa schiedti]|nr:DUF1264 domain protein [Pelomyxa schiedti]